MPLDQLQKLFKKQQIITESGNPEGFSRYMDSTAPDTQAPLAIVKPWSELDVITLTKWALKNNVSMNPISTGQNWGYSDSSAATKGQLIIDFREMNEIISFDEKIGIITIQPGVTQGQVYEFLEKKNSDFMTPLTGAGPSCSLVGNTLERGFGLNAIADHFSALYALRGVVADGTIYQSAFTAMSRNHTPVFKWHTGPYMDGIFAQSNTILVTEMTLALAVKPQSKTLVLAECLNEEDFYKSIHVLRDIFNRYGGFIGSIQMSDKSRGLSLMVPYPEHIKFNSSIPMDEINDMAKIHGIKDWSFYFTVCGDSCLNRIIARKCKKLLKKTTRVTVLSENTVKILHNILSRIPLKIAQELSFKLSMLKELLRMMEGRPTEMALSLAYWNNGRKKPKKDLNPARDGCGLLWFCPVIPLTSQDLRCSVEIIRQICIKHGFDPTISATAMSNRCLEATVPILYDKDTQSANVKACYRELFEACREHGYLPYRYPNFFMPDLVNSGDTYWDHVQKIKDALDPQHIISRGRYSRLKGSV